MKCQVEGCALFTVNDVVWKCIGCDFAFHAICAGVQRKCEDQLLRYMVPMCRSCSVQVSNIQQTTKQLEKQSRSLRKIEAGIDGFVGALDCFKPNEAAVRETRRQCDVLAKSVCENLDTKNAHLVNELHTLKTELMAEIHHYRRKTRDELTRDAEKTLESAKNAQLINELHELRTELTADVLHQQKKMREELTSEFVVTLESVAEELRKSREERYSLESRLKKDFLEEVKNAVDTVLAGHRDTTTTKNTPAPAPSLADELAGNSTPSTEDPQTGTIVANRAPSVGWRDFGHKKVWKPPHEWEDYDRHMSERSDPAEPSTSNSANVRSRRQRRRRRTGNSTDNSDNSHNNNNISNDVTGNLPTSNGLGSSSNSCIATLPSSDKKMLAMAKLAFSGNSSPPEFINFRRGETLNPSSSATARQVSPSSTMQHQPGTTRQLHHHQQQQYQWSTTSHHFDQPPAAAMDCHCRPPPVVPAPHISPDQPVCDCDMCRRHACHQLSGRNFRLH